MCVWFCFECELPLRDLLGAREPGELRVERGSKRVRWGVRHPGVSPPVQVPRAGFTSKFHKQVPQAGFTSRFHEQVPQAGSTSKFHEQVPRASSTSKFHEQVPQASSTSKFHEQVPQASSTSKFHDGYTSSMGGFFSFFSRVSAPVAEGEGARIRGRRSHVQAEVLLLGLAL